MKSSDDSRVLRAGASLLALLPLACGDDAQTSATLTTDPLTVPTTFTSGVDTSGSPSGTDSATDDLPTQGSMSNAMSATDTATTTVDPTTVDPSNSTSNGPVTAVDTTGETTDTTGAVSIGTTDPGTSSTTTDPGTTTGDPPCAPNTCSDDLQSVECGGEVVDVCSNGTYCIDGACVPLTACEAAELLKGSEGCEFWAVKTGLIAEGSGACFAAFVANTADEPVHIEVEYNGAILPVANFARIPQGQGQNLQYQPYDAVAGLPAGEVAILFLSRSVNGALPACPASPAIAQETHVPATGLGKAFRISTDQPVAAYQMLPYGGGSSAATSATLMLPVSVWDVNYIAVNAYQQSSGVPLFAVVANEDGTEVTVDPKVAVVNGPGVQGGPAGVPIKYNLSRGQTIQFAQGQELTGSPIASNKRVGVFGGATCMNVPTNTYACDGAHQQIPPVKALGTAYAAVRYRNRTNIEESPPWRLVGAVDGTQLTYIPAKPAGAPDVINLGQVVEFTAGAPYLVQSQDIDHPFYLGGYMTGGDNFQMRGDPEWVNVIPSAQYLKRYVLFTDPTYPETSVVVVRNRQDGAFSEVSLDCVGNLGGWTALGPDQEWTRHTLVTGNFQNQGNCSNGRQEMKSDAPFGVTVWGWGSEQSVGFFSQYVSYAYPAGAGIKSINDVVVMPQ